MDSIHSNSNMIKILQKNRTRTDFELKILFDKFKNLPFLKNL